MADDHNSRGRSAGRQAASERKLSPKRRFSFIWTSSDPVSTPETDPIDYTTFLPSPYVVSRALPSTSEDIFPPLNRTDPSLNRTDPSLNRTDPPLNRTDWFRPPTSPLLTPKQNAQRYLRTARLALLQLLGHQHPLMTRVRLDGSLKRTALLTRNDLSPSEKRLARRGPNTLAEKTRKTMQHRSGLSNEVRSDNQGNRVKLSFEELLVSNCSTTQLVAAYMNEAKKEELKRRKALKEEARKANAQLEMEMETCGLSEVFDRCAALADELEEDEIFPSEIGIAI